TARRSRNPLDTAACNGAAGGNRRPSGRRGCQAPTRFDEHSDEGRGGAQHFHVFLGTRRVDSLKVDLVVGRTLAGVPETRTLQSAVDIAWPVDWPQVRLYPVIDHIADKICAMYERRGKDGEHGSNRYRDLADLLLISQQEAVPGQAVGQALHREAERRRSLGTRVVLPASFEAPGPDWHDKYPLQAAVVLGLQGCGSFAEAATAAAAFIDPMLSGTAHGTWNPHQKTWT
ncbi:nucleotidyl transferase AbiEii/AbiGii toxin family protein, partial [Streptomyces sp. NPDC006967]|uniref:nucleotidyl transferase AbiEii/AbiGii toxin family protein n=1 Tax=Streptomyces sp. NPDC006967 TaxID=3156906 RepID=UPI0033D76B50